MDPSTKDNLFLDKNMDMVVSNPFSRNMRVNGDKIVNKGMENYKSYQQDK